MRAAGHEKIGNLLRSGWTGDICVLVEVIRAQISTEMNIVVSSVL